MKESDIQAYLNSYDLDVRKTKDGTWIDQKCTPDVVSYVAECILNYMDDIGSDEYDAVFTIKDIMLNGFSKDNIIVFGKPDVVQGSNEYDKFFSQPIKLLSYSNVLKNLGKEGNTFQFKIANLDLLEYIGDSERKAQTFLNVYVKKVLSDSGQWDVYEDYFNDQTAEKFNLVKKSFEDFMCGNTRRGGSRGGDLRDIRRVFPKAFNILAVARHGKGTIGGYISHDVIQREDILYNRRNFYDEFTGKPKGLLRTEHSGPIAGEDEARTTVEINKAKRKVKNYNRLNNNKKTETYIDIAMSIDEILAEKEKDEINKFGSEAHHIFPKGQFPSIAFYLENLITLTPNQHLLYAHPDRNPNQIDRLYQYYLLLCKTRRIRIDDEGFYSKEKYVEVLNIGFRTEDFTGMEDDFAGIVNRIKEEYGDVLE